MEPTAQGVVLGAVAVVLGVALLRRPDLLFRYLVLGRRWAQAAPASPSPAVLLAGRLLGAGLVLVGALVAVGIIDRSAG